MDLNPSKIRHVDRVYVTHSAMSIVNYALQTCKYYNNGKVKGVFTDTRHAAMRLPLQIT